MLNRILYVILLGILIKFLLDIYVSNDNEDNNNNNNNNNNGELIKNKEKEEETTGNNNDDGGRKTLNIYTADELNKICSNNKYFLAILGNVYDVTKGEKVLLLFLFQFVIFFLRCLF